MLHAWVPCVSDVYQDVASVSCGCCKSRSRCFNAADVAKVDLRCFNVADVDSPHRNV
jgi:hypothetical protein